MLYTSPFELLNLPQAELQQIDKKLLQLKKKQWMAELQLQDSGILSVNGRELTKNDVLQLFDQLEHTDALAFHAAIAADPVLLAFLQTGKSKPGERFTDNPLYQDPAFIEFVSPFFREAFNRHILKALAASDHARIQGVFGNPLLLTGSDYDDCLGRLRGYLDEKLHEVAQLRNNLANDRRADMGSLHSYYVYDWVVTLNKLPDHFMPFREDYAIELYNLAVDLWNSKRRDEARAVLYGIQSLHTAPPIQSMIEELIQKTGKVAEPASSSGGGGNVAWVIISLLLIIFKAGSTCNNNKSDYDFSRLIEKNNHPYQTSMRVGFMPLKPLTPRDSAFTAFLSTLFASATANDQEKGKALANGDDPYKALFAKDLFKPLVSQKAPPSESVAMEEDAPKAAPDKPIYRNKKVYNESDEKISTITADEEPPMVVRDNEVDNPPTTSPIDIYNQSNYGCILFFYSSRIIKSVYVQPQSTYRLQLPKGTFHAFCYAGNHFKTGLAISMGKGANLTARKAFANMPRFAESPPSMRRYLLPANNLHFKAGNLNTSIETTASITINPNEKPSVDMMSGKGVTAYRTIVTGAED